ncbi:MAG: transcriptional regulator [Clostridiales bacterium]|nr:transcriptional regulator [Clostridiales bacterium]
MDVSVPKAYKIIRTLNAELNEKGYITVAGKVNRLFFEEKIYCGTSS